MKIALQWQAQTQHIPISNTLLLAGFLNVPAHALGMVLFVHGSGSSRHSPRNQYVAQALHKAGFATLLIDLFTEREEEYDRYTGHLRFDIQLLSERVAAITRWLIQDDATSSLNIGYFGASTGAAAALVAETKHAEKRVSAVVSRGGRPDLAGAALTHVEAPTLLIVGELDTSVMVLNQTAYDQLHGEKQLAVVRGATHLFEEPGTLEQVAALAGDWFGRYLPQPGAGE